MTRQAVAKHLTILAEANLVSWQRRGREKLHFINPHQRDCGALDRQVRAPTGEAVKLTISHEMEKPGTQFIDAVSSGWPLILSNLKSLLETGEVAMREKIR
jgi:hypothetical protein